MWLPPPKLKSVGKADYNAEIGTLKKRLLDLQFELRDNADFPVLIVLGGVDGAGKHEMANLLSAWLDPRYVVTLAYGAPTEEERERPEMWRFWRDLPGNGRIAAVLSGWYSQPLLDHVKGSDTPDEFRHRLGHVSRFETNLVANGALVLKFWMHLSQDQQRERLMALAADPMTVWHVRPKDWQHLHLYDHFAAATEEMLTLTDTKAAPWLCVDGSDERARRLKVARTIIKALEKRLSRKPRPPKIDFKGAKKPVRLHKLDMNASIDNKKDYNKQLQLAQTRLLRLHQMAYQLGRGTVLVFEGWDAAGKGGAIRRIAHALDARHYRVLPVAAPNDEERARHYLWRFWRSMPRAGHMRVFDRSWYGRVLVERVEGFADKADWQRAYSEINDFEAQLVESGCRVLKFWIHITSDEQLARFKARETDPLKDWKLTEEDWRNRGRWDDYELAVEDMIDKTHTPNAPWVLVAGNDKRHARVQVINSVCDLLEDKEFKKP